MSIEWVRRMYQVPAKVGGRVEYSGGGTPRLGTICSVRGGHVYIRLDGDKHALPHHPTWKIRYLDEAAV